MGSQSLEECRNRIDQLDSQIVSLIEKRMAVSKEIGQIKLCEGKPVFDESRETMVLNSVSGKAQSLVGRLAVKEVYGAVFEASKRLQRLLHTDIFLIGMPGCGKTTTGRELAGLLGMNFMDADELFLERNKVTAADCIRNEGETAFRKKETECLKELCTLKGYVIALGGGVVTVEENFHLVRESGRTVFLSCPTEKLEVSNRPISQRVGVDEIVKVREPLYRRWADIIIERGSVDESCFKIAEQLFAII